MSKVYTIGHSTHPMEEFIELLDHYGVKQLVDIRSVPGSRHNPQFSQAALKESLEKHGITYIYLKKLGGWRRRPDTNTNAGWRNASFRSYANYMQTSEFEEGIHELLKLAAKSQAAIMCAEAVPWRCHRSLVSDALLVRDVEVRDIMSLKSSPVHKLTSFAKVGGTTITYPVEKSST